LFVFLGICVLSLSFGSMFYGGRVIFALVRNPIQTSSTNEELSLAEKERRKLAQKRALPLTRLVITCAIFLLAITLTTFIASFSGALYSPNTYWIVFWIISFCEITVFSLVIHTLSPIWQEHRKQSQAAAQVRGGSATGLTSSPLGGKDRAGSFNTNMGGGSSTRGGGGGGGGFGTSNAGDMIISTVAGDN
jgi:hypothetical protein